MKPRRLEFEDYEKYFTDNYKPTLSGAQQFTIKFRYSVSQETGEAHDDKGRANMQKLIKEFVEAGNPKSGPNRTKLVMD